MTEANKSLIYVVNKVSKNDSQHFVHIPNLLNQLEGKGWEIRLVSERGGVGEGNVSGIPVTYLSKDARWGRIPKLLKTLVSARFRGNKLVFVRISKSSALLSGIAGRLLGWKTLFWLCGAVEDFNLREKGWRGKFEIGFLWVLFRVVDHLVTGPETMNAYYRNYYRLPQKKVLTLYNDVEIDPDFARCRGESGKTDLLRMLMVHRYSPVRETMRWFPDLLATLKTRHEMGKPVRFDIIGGGPELIEMQEAAESFPELDLSFHGTMPNREINRFYSEADLFVMPSYREGFPRVVIEAMAHSLPIVCTDAGGTRDLFGPLQSPYCVDRDNSKRFACAVDQLLSNEELRNRLAEENCHQARRFSTQEVVRQYDQTLGNVLA